MLTTADILTAARIGRDAVTALCERAGLTDEALRAEIERTSESWRHATACLRSAALRPRFAKRWQASIRDLRLARTALETELARRTAAPATHATPKPT